MDTTEWSEGKYITAEVVKSSPNKIAVIMDEAKPEKTDYGESLHVNVQFNGKYKIWRLNKDSVKNMHQIGTDSRSWINRKVQFNVISAKGKEVVLGFPVLTEGVAPV